MKALALATCVTCLATVASAQNYMCDMTNRGNGGWIGKKMAFKLDPAAGKGSVKDAITASVQEAFVNAELTKRSDTLWVYRWDVEGVTTSNDGSTSLKYRALLNTKNGRLTVSGRLLGYDNQISGTGKCKPV